MSAATTWTLQNAHDKSANRMIYREKIFWITDQPSMILDKRQLYLMTLKYRQVHKLFGYLTVQSLVKWQKRVKHSVKRGRIIRWHTPSTCSIYFKLYSCVRITFKAILLCVFLINFVWSSVSIFELFLLKTTAEIWNKKENSLQARNVVN